MSEIRYDHHKKTVRQLINTISLYDFTGDFDEVIKKLKEYKQHYNERYVKNACEVAEVSYAQVGAYLDGAKKKKVKFDRIYIDDGESYGERVFQVWGERKFDEAELKAAEDAEDKRKEDAEAKEREIYERLKKKFE